jgi:hypothetical protein
MHNGGMHDESLKGEFAQLRNPAYTMISQVWHCVLITPLTIQPLSPLSEAAQAIVFE